MTIRAVPAAAVLVALVSSPLGQAQAGQPCPVIADPQPLNTNAAYDSGNDAFPQLTSDGEGNWVAVWWSRDHLGGTIGTDKDILFSRSTDNGASWTAPAALNSNANSDGGFTDDTDPQLTSDGAGNWVAVWWSEDDLGGTIGTDPDILYSQSTDNGVSWTVQAALNTNAATDSGNDVLPQITTDGQGNWLAVWDSRDDLSRTIGIDRDILFARSMDNGTTWTDPAPLNTNAFSDSGDDVFPQLTTDGAGNWVAVWGSNDSQGGTIGDDADVLFSRSTDNGQSWSAPAALNTNAASDIGADGFPQLTTDGVGNWIAAWESQDDLGGAIGSDADLLFSLSKDHGLSWTTPSVLNANAFSDSANDVQPQLATDRAGNWLAVWNSRDNIDGEIGSDSDILLCRSVDDGATWTAPAALATNAASDSGGDAAPQLTTDTAGNWVAVWYTTDDLGGTIGKDFDLLVARFQLSADDCNDNGSPDECDIADGSSNDINGNGIPDECDECLDDSGCDEGEVCVDGVCVAVPDPCADNDGDGMVTICHFPPGSPGNSHTISVGARAVPAHLAHGDSCGPCEQDDGLLLRVDESEVCSADVNGDGVVNAADLALLLGTWGQNPGHPTDFNGDAVVGPFDLATLLGNWGACP